MKIPGLPYDFELELQQVSFKSNIKTRTTAPVAASAMSSGDCQLLVDADAEIVAVLRWANATERTAKPPKAPSIALVPFGNVSSMVPLVTK